MKKTLLIAIISLLTLNFTARSQVLDNTVIPDSSFNKFGYRRTLPTFYYPAFTTTANGTMFVAASQSAQVYPATAMDLDLTKLKNNGEPDTSFGINGVARVNILALNSGINQFRIRSIYVQTDGKIMVLASAGSQYSNPQYEFSRGLHMLFRFKPNGRLDSTFANNGTLMGRVTPTNEDQPTALAVDETMPAQPKYYVGGSSLPYGYWHLGPTMFFITRYLHNGTIDPGFNGTGYLQGSGTLIHAATGTGHVGHMQMKVVANQKLLVTGAHSSRKFFMMRLNPNGNFDSSFAGTGRVLRQVSFISALNSLGATHILPDNSVAFTSEDITYSYTPTAYDSLYFHAARQNADGTPMMNFGVNGELHYNYTAKGMWHTETFDDRGRMLLGYYRHIGSTASQKIHLARFTSGGLLDTSFVTNGVLESEPIVQDTWLNPGALMGGLQYSSDHKKLYLCGTYAKAPGDFGIIALRYKYPEKPVNNSVQSVQDLAATVYPNPATNELHIQLAKPGQNVHVRLLSTDGRVVSDQVYSSTNNITLLLNQVQAGFYFLHIEDEQKHRYTSTISKL